MMQLAKKVPFEDPQVLMAVRGLYILSNVLILGLHLYTQAKINAKKGMWLIACDHVLPPLSRREECRRTCLDISTLQCNTFTNGASSSCYRHDYPQVR